MPRPNESQDCCASEGLEEYVFGFGLGLICWVGVDGCGRDFRERRRPEGRMWVRRKIREWR